MTTSPGPIGADLADVAALRQRYLSPALLTYYKEPLMIVEGSMQYLYDETGRRYLDGFGGIVTVSVGHSHPYVLQKAKEQLDLLQHTTTIYYHPTIAAYGKMLADKMPGDLSVCYFVNSSSEANDLAMLMARLYTGNYDLIALRNAYHGGSASTMGLTAHSTWKYDYPGPFRRPPCGRRRPYHGPWGRDDPDAGRVRFRYPKRDPAHHVRTSRPVFLRGHPGRQQQHRPYPDPVI